ncbi:MAG: hypothetical protein J7K75_10800 [Desulfuromonas sp.]|nr:hypothetical protein [Desulfuromonas sp.]
MTKPLNAVIVFVLLCCAVFFGCDNTKLTPIPEHGVILAFGDNVTVGVGADSSHSYHSTLSTLNFRV